MIKLIASDMDGTLLDDEKNLPPDFFGVLDELFERRIVFTVASGRTYSAVDHLFPEKYREKIAYICDNGACTVYNGVPKNVFPLDRRTYEELLAACAEIGRSSGSELKMVVCAESGVYHLNSSDSFFDEVGKFYKLHSAIDDLLDVDDLVYKLAVCDMLGAMTHGKPELDKIFGGRLNVQVSGDIWLDIMAAGVSKGTALRALQKDIGADRTETMAFGDYFNDLDMLLSADWSFCPENGHGEVKKVCRFIAPDNNHGGVTQCIKRYALSEVCV